MILKTYCVRSKQKILDKLLLITKITSILIFGAYLQVDAGVLPPFEIHGRVINQEGNPLQGVSVLIAGTQNGTTTNSDGRFTLNIPDANTVLEISSVGFQPKKVNVGNEVEITIILEKDVAGLSNVVVVGYGTQSKRNITSSITSVSSKDISNYPVQQVGQALQGKVAGLQIVQNSGSPGSALTVRIRGIGTVNNSDPLYVVDGNLGVSPSNIDPNNIETIEVLKSASAAAIYGAQGANGVILITTKTGVKGPAQINANFYSGTQQAHRFMPMMNGKQYATIYNEALVNGGRAPLFTDVESLGVGTDWQDAIYRVAPVNNVELSASGGTEQGKYYISAGYFDQKGIVLSTDYKRINFRINSEYKLRPAVTLGENLSLSYAVQNTIFARGINPVANSWRMDPTAPIKNPDGTWGYPKFADTKNPVAELYFNNNTDKIPVLNGSVYLDIKPFKNLVYRSQVNVNLGFTNNYNFLPTYDVFPLMRNLTTQLSRSDSRSVNYDWQNTLTFKKTQGSHDISILGGVTVQSSQSEDIFASGQGVPVNANTDPNLRYLDLAKIGQTVSGGGGDFSMLSFLGRVNYSYKGTYLFTGNFRADGSSRFGRNNRFGYFPSLSVGWRISDESFMENISFINDLKIRAGWGMLGNQNSLSNYSFANSLTSNLNYVFGPNVVQGQALTSQGNPDLKWEATTETEIGFDFTGFEHRVTLSMGYYNRKTTDMLLRVPIPAFTGVQTPGFTNGGDVLNKGIEVSLGYRKITPGAFFYDVSVNLSHNTNQVTRLSNSLAFITSGNARTTVGSSIGEFYGYVMDGLFQTDADVQKHAFQTNGTAPGDIRFKDLNDDGVIDQNDRTTIGNPWPELMYGVTANFGWKKLDLSLALQGVYGNDIYANWKSGTEGSNFFNYDLRMLDAWKGEGSSNSIPKVNVNNPNNNLRESTYFVENGSYLRLKHIQIGYTLPLKEKNIFKKIRIYIASENLLTFTKYPGFDPEISNGSSLSIGQDSGLYPQPQTITAGVNLNL